MKSLIFIINCLLFVGVNAQQASYEWSSVFSGNKVQIANEVESDDSLNVIIAGVFWDNSDFDPGPGTAIMNPVGSNDIFLCKLDQYSNYLWSFQLGVNYSLVLSDMTIDPYGNIILVGEYLGTEDFNPGSSTSNLSSVGNSRDCFIAKYSSSGRLMWARSIGGNGKESEAIVRTNSLGDVFIAGQFENTADFDPSSSLQNLSAQDDDIYVLKLDSAGRFIWVKQIGGPKDEILSDFEIAFNGDLFIAGAFRDSCDFNPDVNSSEWGVSDSLSQDAFVLQLDSLGRFKFVNSFQSPGKDNVTQIIPDSNALQSYFVIEYGDSLQLDTSHLLIPISNSDIAICSFDSLQSLNWIAEINGTSSEKIYNLLLDSNGILFCGSFRDTLSFNNSAVSFYASGVNDGYFGEVSKAGSFNWVEVLGSDDWGLVSDISLNQQKDILCAGMFNGIVDFNFGTGIVRDTSSGEDAFVMKLNRCTQTGKTVITDTVCNFYTTAGGLNIYSSTGTYTENRNSLLGCDSIIEYQLVINDLDTTNLSISACDTFINRRGQVFTSNAFYWDTLSNQAQCDSLVLVGLTIYNTAFSFMNDTACEQYQFPSGKTTFQSGRYNDTIQSAQGCDSIISIQVLIDQASLDSLNQSACDSSLSISGNDWWTNSGVYYDTLRAPNRCDRVFKVNLEINQSTFASITDAFCDPYTAPSGNQVWRAPGGYTDTIQNQAGCDSVLYIFLQVDSNLGPLSIIQQGASLVANSADTNFSWLNCQFNYRPITGENRPVYTPSNNGNYAVEGYSYGCLDTSNCIPVTNVSLNEETSSFIQLAPNPGKGTINILVNQRSELPLELEVFDTRNRLIYSSQIRDEADYQIQLEAKPGLYFVKFKSGGQLIAVRKYLYKP